MLSTVKWDTFELSHVKIPTWNKIVNECLGGVVCFFNSACLSVIQLERLRRVNVVVGCGSWGRLPNFLIAFKSMWVCGFRTWFSCDIFSRSVFFFYPVYYSVFLIYFLPLFYCIFPLPFNSFIPSTPAITTLLSMSMSHLSFLLYPSILKQPTPIAVILLSIYESVSV